MTPKAGYFARVCNRSRGQRDGPAQQRCRGDTAYRMLRDRSEAEVVRAKRTQGTRCGIWDPVYRHRDLVRYGRESPRRQRQGLPRMI